MTHADTRGFRSTQCIALQPPTGAGGLEAYGQKEGLARLLDDYFAVAEESALHVVSVHWRSGRPEFVLRWPGLTLIGMGAPAFELGADRNAVSLAVEGGMLVGPTRDGRLTISLERETDSVRACVDLAGYLPRGGGAWLVRFLYTQTQARVHAWVGKRYLQRLYALNARHATDDKIWHAGHTRFR